MKIAFLGLENEHEEYAKKVLKKHQLSFYRNHLDEQTLALIKDVDVLAVFVFSPVTRAVIDSLPKLRLVTTMSTGFDHIDLEYCKKKKITVCNVPTYGENTVAEHTFALILALSRRLYQAIERTHKQHSFETDSSLRGFDLKGKTLGVVGCGHIGRHVARIGVGFEMNVVAFDHYRDEKQARKIGFTYAPFDAILKKSDILTLHVPYMKQTHHLIDAKAIRKMKKGALIINTARGGIIDTPALVDALESGKLAGAGLDVLEGECEIKEEASVLKKEYKATCNQLTTLLEDHELMKMENVIITPHNAFNSKEALQRILDTTIQNIVSFAQGKVENQVK